MLTYARVCSRMRTCNAGTDCTEIFAASHSAQAWKDLEGFYLGDLLTDSADATELAAGAAGVLLRLLLRLLLHFLPFYAAFTAALLRCRAGEIAPSAASGAATRRRMRMLAYAEVC